MIEFSKNTAVVFPGQGSQVVGMGADLYESSEDAKSIFEEVNQTLDRNLSEIIFSGSQEDLNKTENAQPAITATSLACLAVFKEKYPKFQPNATAGHSLGEYTSLCASNSLSISDTIKLVSERGRLMQIACDKNPGGMVALIGMDIQTVEEVCREAGAYPSNINSEQQIIISGDNDALAIAVDLAKARGAKKAIKLSVGGAFHSILMEPARDSLIEFIETLDFKDPEIPLIGNVNAEPLTSSEDIKNELIDQLMSCVQWNDTIKYMSANGYDQFIEFGPGKVLSGLIKRIDSNCSTSNIDSLEALEFSV
ncbi:MAG: ACP S-malonyltransferase [Chloroflexota bacterium]|nr:ACP S-malonyltransferase [Chloroflexota bacterium]MEC9451009.1 ACP S-malonyltransferase [Chloroflexota bacterium]MQG04391.1 ACP S-malonyltransferase [SAR202 cluster bacterium]|tara:strand:+ start:180 stop:1106 length:927 start_codon:yes stop_codon:yes gene_type:complete